MRSAPLELRDLTEKQLQRQLVDLAQATGWKRTYHTFDSRRSSSGFPDLVLVRERVVFVELKTERGRPSDAQRDWIEALLAAGAEAYIVRPRHLDAIAAVLGARTRDGIFLNNMADRHGRALKAATREEIAPRDTG